MRSSRQEGLLRTTRRELWTLTRILNHARSPLPRVKDFMTYTIFHPTFHPTPGTHFTALVQFSRRRKTSTEGVGSLLGHGRAGDTMTPRPSKHDPRGYTASGTALQEERWHRPFDRARLNLLNMGENTNPGLTWVSYPVSTGCVGSGSLEPPYA